LIGQAQTPNSIFCYHMEITLKDIVSILREFLQAPMQTNDNAPLQANVNIGKFVIIRCEAAGVHCGTLERVDGDMVTLSRSRRLWRWHAKAGVALSGLAVHGLETAKENKIDSVVDQIVLRNWCEIIPAPGLEKVWQ